MARLYTSSNEQAIINYLQVLEILKFKEGLNWMRHLNKFHDILSKPASLDKAASDSEKLSKLICTHPEHFAPISMISGKLSYNELLTTISTETSRRKAKDLMRKILLRYQKRLVVKQGTKAAVTYK